MTLTLTYDLDLQSPASHGHAKFQGQRLVGSEDTGWPKKTKPPVVHPADAIVRDIVKRISPKC